MEKYLAGRKPSYGSEQGAGVCLDGGQVSMRLEQVENRLLQSLLGWQGRGWHPGACIPLLMVQALGQPGGQGMAQRPLSFHTGHPAAMGKPTCASRYSMREETAVVWVRSRFFSASAIFQSYP